MISWKLDNKYLKPTQCLLIVKIKNTTIVPILTTTPIVQGIITVVQHSSIQHESFDLSRLEVILTRNSIEQAPLEGEIK